MNNIVPGSFQLMKKINTGLILDTIKSRGPISRADVARLLNLTPATVTNITAELIERNVITEGELGVSSGGRKPIMLMLNNDAYYVVGIQIDTGKIRTAVLNLETQILFETAVLFNSNISDTEIINLVKKAIHDIIEGNPIEKGKILGIGVGINGIVNFNNGIIVYSPIFRTENIELRYILENEFDTPVYIDRDVRTMALCESWSGSGRDVETFICINVGKSICAAVINNKQPIRGASEGLGEIGHMKICSTGPECSCGNHGCLESYASENAIIRYACELSNEIENNILDIHNASAMGEKACIDAFKKAGEYLGIGIANLINTFNPAVIIVGGELIDLNDFYFDSMIKSACRNSLKQLYSDVNIMKTSAKNNAVLKGTSLLVFDNIFDTLNR